MYYVIVKEDELSHSGVIGQKWGERRYQYYDGSLTPAGRAHYGVGPPRGSKAGSTGAKLVRKTEHGVSDDERSVKQIFNTLSDKDKQRLTSGGTYNHSSNVASRTVLKDKDGSPMAYAEIETDPDDKKVGYVSVAVDPKFRGQGLSEKACAEAIKKAKKQGLKEIYWETEKDNPASAKAARKLGFEPAKNFSKDEDNYVLRIGAGSGSSYGGSFGGGLKGLKDRLFKKKDDNDPIAQMRAQVPEAKRIGEDSDVDPNPLDITGMRWGKQPKAGSLFAKRQKETTGKSQEEIIQDIVDHGGVRDIANNMGKMSTEQLRAAKSRLEATQALRKQIQSEDYEKVDNFIEKYNRVGKVVQTTGNMADSASKVTNFISNVNKLFGKESPEVEAANKAANAAKAAAKVTEAIINRADPKEIYENRTNLSNAQRKQAKENIEMDRAIKRLAEEADNRDKSGGNQEPSQKSNKNQGNQPQNNSGKKNDDRPSNITSTGFKTKDNPDDAARYRINDDTVTRDQLKDRQIEDYRIPDNTVDRDEMLKRLIKKANKK